MTQFTSYDGTKLAFRRAGAGRPLVCLPGGPGRTPDYLGGLGDDAARAHALVGVSERARAVQAGFYAPGAFDPPAIRAGLAA